MFELNTNKNTVYFMMVYSNPPSDGYKKAFDKIKSMSKDADHAVFLSPYQDNFLNPLPHDRVVHYNMRVFPDVKFYRKYNVKNSLDALYYLSQHYSNIFMLTNDDKVRNFDRFYEYADDWNVFEFDVLGLGLTENDIEEFNRETRESVLNDDYNTFKQTIPSKDEKLLSKLFLELRKIMVGGDSKDTSSDNESKDSDSKKEKNEDIEYITNKIINFTMDKNKNLSILEEYAYKDSNGNNYLKLEDIDKNYESMNDIRIVFSNKVKSFSVGKCNFSEEVVIFVNSNIEKVDKLLEMKKPLFKNSIKNALKLKETTTAGNIATVNSTFGQPIKRRDEDVSFVRDIKKDNREHNKFQKAMKEYIDKYGYIDTNAIEKIKKELGEK